METKKKRNPQDITLRNLRALHKRIDKLEKYFEKKCEQLEKALKKQQTKKQK